MVLDAKHPLMRFENAHVYLILRLERGGREMIGVMSTRLLNSNQLYSRLTNRLAREINRRTGVETRVMIPGHIQRGGSPSALDRALSTEVGAYAGYLCKEGLFGTTVAILWD